MNPISDFLTMVAKYKPEPRYWFRTLAYFLKVLVAEPIRRLETRTLGPDTEPLPHDPIFILGYYRSGTTHLQEVLMQDSRFGYMNFFQGFVPTAHVSTERWVKPLFERIVRLIGFLHPAHQIPFSFELPAEEDVAHVFTASTLAANWAQLFPKHFRGIYRKTGLLEDLSKVEREQLKQELHRMYLRVSQKNGGKRLILKSPPQTARIELLKEMYPNAQFVFIRRDPYDCYASNMKLWKSFEQNQLQVQPKGLAEDCFLWSYDQVHWAYETQKRSLAKGDLVEVTFEEFMTQPMATIERIYRGLDLGEWSQQSEAIEAYLATKHQGERRPYTHTEDALEAIEDGLGHWLEEWGYHRYLTTDLGNLYPMPVEAEAVPVDIDVTEATWMGAAK